MKGQAARIAEAKRVDGRRRRLSLQHGVVARDRSVRVDAEHFPIERGGVLSASGLTAVAGDDP